MALRVRSGPTPSRASAVVGETVLFTAKAENTSAEPALARLVVSGLQGGVRPLDMGLRFQPEAVEVKGKSRAALAFTWTASLPEGEASLTLRGTLRLEDGHGRLVATAPLDVHVRRA